MEVDPSLSAWVNAPLLEQALGNLLDNAIKYSPSGVEVDIFTERADDMVRIHVRDRGCGIAPEHQKRLFQRFYRVDRARSRALGGTGLGLAIVKHIVLAHRGSVEIASDPGVGSTFTLCLPTTPPTGVHTDFTNTVRD